MLRKLADLIQTDPDFPGRVHDLLVLNAVLDGTLYDGLQFEFHQETQLRKKIMMSDRAPCVRSALCSTIVDDTIAFLFGEQRFPKVDLGDPETTARMAKLLASAHVESVMQDVARFGSVGSTALQVRVIKGALDFVRLETTYLLPEWDPDRPGHLLKVTERRKIPRDEVIRMGYAIPLQVKSDTFWWQRIWDGSGETWFTPTPCGDPEFALAQMPPVIDQDRSTLHNLGVCPVVWIKNLPARDPNAIDGACTFRRAVETEIEIDYQMSQGARALRYSADPTLVIVKDKDKNSSLAQGGEEIAMGADEALIVSGDAKMLEISGGASKAVVDFAAALREMALEAVHGNRSSPENMRGAVSAVALRMHWAPVILLVDRLRQTYGAGLLAIVAIVRDCVARFEVHVDGAIMPDFSNAPAATLVWPDYFPPTDLDRTSQASALGSLLNSGLISRETAAGRIADAYGIEDAGAELLRIQADEAAAAQRALAIGAQIKATEVIEE